MDLYKAIRELIEERKRVDKTIALLEEMLAKGNSAGPVKPARASGKRRGRKSMGPEERKQVAERMARYWAARRAAKEKNAETGTEEGASAADTGERSTTV